jgi:hypothetical protein
MTSQNAPILTASDMPGLTVDLDLNLETHPLHNYGKWDPIQGRISRKLRYPNPVLEQDFNSSTLEQYDKMYQQTSFLHLMARTYSNHYSIAIAPHDLWFVLMTEVAQEIIAQPETYRNLFTTSAAGSEKQSIIMQPPFDVEVLMMELKKLVPTQIEMFCPNFSTHTAASKIATMAAFAEAVTPYYSYMVLSCGIRQVKILGQLSDWELFSDSLTWMRWTLGMPWLKTAEARIKNIVKSLKGGDTSFYMDIFKNNNIGSGGEAEINGWFASDFLRPDEKRDRLPTLNNFPNLYSVLPYKNLDNNKNYVQVWGAFQSTSDANSMLMAGYDSLTFAVDDLVQAPVKNLWD